MGPDLSLLLDTSTLIWAVSEPERNSPAARAALDSGDRLLVSAASAWEIATKQRIGRLTRVHSLVVHWDRELERFNLEQLDISHRHALRGGSIDVDHSDPFDRVIAAQAELDDLTLVAKDRAFDLFPIRRLW